MRNVKCEITCNIKLFGNFNFYTLYESMRMFSGVFWYFLRAGRANGASLVLFCLDNLSFARCARTKVDSSSIYTVD